MAKTVVIKTARIPADMARRIEDLARIQGTSENEIMRECLRRALPELEAEARDTSRPERPGR